MGCEPLALVGLRLFYWNNDWFTFDELIAQINKETGYNITREELAKLRVLV
jgi:hypothetical protein